MTGLTSYKTLVHACAGCAGSSCASVLTMPLTTAFTRIQLDDNMKSAGPIRVMLKLVRDEGFLTLFRGCQSTLLSVAVSNFVYFYSFHGLKTLSRAEHQTALRDLLYACCAGILNVLLTNPLWVVNSRLKMSGVTKGDSQYRGLLDGLIKIALQEGVGTLWNGTKASLLLVSNPAIKFTFYELLKRQWGRPVKGGSAFILGCMATAIATLFTYPLQMVQAQARHGSQSGGIIEIGSEIVYQNGVVGLYRGVDSKLLQSVTAAGFMFMSYENIFQLVNNMMGVQTATGCRRLN